MLFPMPPSLLISALFELVATLVGEILLALIPKRVKQSPVFAGIAAFSAIALVGAAVWYDWTSMQI